MKNEEWLVFFCRYWVTVSIAAGLLKNVSVKPLKIISLWGIDKYFPIYCYALAFKQYEFLAEYFLWFQNYVEGLSLSIFFKNCSLIFTWYLSQFFFQISKDARCKCGEYWIHFFISLDSFWRDISESVESQS